MSMKLFGGGRNENLVFFVHKTNVSAIFAVIFLCVFVYDKRLFFSFRQSFAFCEWGFGFFCHRLGWRFGNKVRFKQGVVGAVKGCTRRKNQ